MSKALRGCVICAVALVMAGGFTGAPGAPGPAGDLPFFYDLYTFRGDAGATTVVAAFAVRAGELEAEARGRRYRYRFDVSLVLADTVLQSVARTDDSVYVAAARSLDGEHLLFTHVQMDARPSRSTVHRVVMTDAATPGVGQLYDEPFPIPDYSGDSLMLSDIALGQPDARSGWRRGDATLALLPTSQFPSSSFDVYYEVYNLPYGNRYTTEILVEGLEEGRRGRPGDDNAVGLRFTGEAATALDGALAEHRRVDATLGRGRYRLTVTVTDEGSGARATRTRDFEVRGWGPGTTFVAARPR